MTAEPPNSEVQVRREEETRSSQTVQLQSTANWVLVPAVLLFTAACRNLVELVDTAFAVAGTQSPAREPEVLTAWWILLALAVAGTFTCAWGAISAIRFFVQALRSNGNSDPQAAAKLTVRQSRLWVAIVFACGWYVAMGVYRQYWLYEWAKEDAAWLKHQLKTAAERE